MDKWQNRYTVRNFVDTELVAQEHIEHLKSMFNHLPTQQSINDNLWFTLTPEHEELKVWLLENIYNRTEVNGVKEYMVQVLSAPLVFLSTLFGNENDHIDANRNIGLHAGTLMEEALSLGYDVATVGCTRNYMDYIDEIRPAFMEKMNSAFGDKIAQHTGATTWTLEPNLAVCIGRGEPLQPIGTYAKYRDYRYAAFKKNPKKWTGII